MRLPGTVTLALVCLAIGFVAGASVARGEDAPDFAEGDPIKDPDPTPLSCDRRKARDHMHAAAAIVRRAHSVRRILHPEPMRRREKRRWHRHQRCVLLPSLRRHIRWARGRAREGFERVYLDLITPPGPAALAARRSCESGNTYLIDTDNGFANAYQFDETSWAATAGSFEELTGIAANPSRLAAPREQDIRTAIWEAASGGDPWPNCP